MRKETQKDEEQDNSHAFLLPFEVRRIKLIRQCRTRTTTLIRLMYFDIMEMLCVPPMVGA